MNRLSIAHPLLIALSIGCAEGFVPPTEQARASVVGRVSFEDGAPAIAMTVHLALEGERVASLVTDSQGRFGFEDAPAGRAQVVANDGAGNGAYRELTIYAGGSNDAGTLVMRTLQLEPRVLEVRGVGYEERIAALPDGFPIGFGPDGRLLVGHWVGAYPQHRLEWIDLRDRSTESAFGARIFQSATILGDGILLASEPESDRFLAYDLGSESMIHQSEPYGELSYWVPPAWPNRDGLLLMEGDTSKPVVVSLSQGVREGPALEVHPGSVRPIISTEEQIIFAAGSHPTRLVSIDRATAAVVEIAAIEMRYSFLEAVLSLDRSHMYLLRGDASAEALHLTSMEIATGEEEELYAVPCAGFQRCSSGLMLDPTSGRLSFMERTDSDRLVSFDPESGVVEPIDVAIPSGSPAENCFITRSDRDLCWSGLIAPGHVRLYTRADIGGVDNQVYVDLIDGRITRALAAPYDLFEGFLGGILARSTDEELVWTSDPETGFVQLFLGPSGQPLSAFRRLTHFRANHHLWTVSPDGRHAYYWARDPVASEFSLFRVALAEGG